jgi:hypothetical protein
MVEGKVGEEAYMERLKELRDRLGAFDQPQAGNLPANPAVEWRNVVPVPTRTKAACSVVCQGHRGRRVTLGAAGRLPEERCTSEASHEASGRRPMRAIIIAAAIILGLGMTVPTATLAAPSCDGRPATIVGTAGDDSISGTGSNDVVVARGGDDDVWGSGGSDIICGGKGDDRLEGAGGDDHLLGNAGEDVLQGDLGDDRLEGGYARDYLNGGAGDDRLAGGRGIDACLQASGRGRLTGCENAYADLAVVTVDCPDAATLDVPFECQVTIENHGPQGAHPIIGNVPLPKDCHGSCAIHLILYGTGHSVHHPDARTLLAAGDQRTDVIEVTVTKWPQETTAQAFVSVRVRPADVFDAIDAHAANDHGSTPIDRA